VITVRRATIIPAPIDTVWAVLRDFNSHAHWHPAIAHSEIEGDAPGDTVGCVRRFRLTTGESLRDQLLHLSDRERELSYCILDAPIPLLDYVSTLRLRPVTDGAGTFWSWEGRFRAPPGQAESLRALVGEGIYQAGFDGLRRHLAPAAAATGSTGAIVVTAHGGPEVLAWRELPLAAPGPGEVTLRHTAIGVNFIDIYARSGRFRLLDPPAVPGMEAAGVVTQIGSGVRGLRPGDRVGYACAPPGAYAQARTMPADLLVPLPDELSDTQAAAGLLKGMTAEFLLHGVHAVQPGDTVLVHAAAGGTGLLLCQWAAALGAIVIGTVSSAAKARIARAHGCAYPVVTVEEDFVARVRDITGGQGARVVYDGIGLDTFARSYEALAVCGHLVSFGQASGPLPPVDLSGFAAKSATVSRPNFGHYTDTPAQLAAVSGRLFQAIRTGVLRIPPPTVMALRDAAEAHRALEARETTGAAVLVP
jgi:NADPH:quinone reductase-like Zn-dependent oxidoreductase